MFEMGTNIILAIRYFLKPLNISMRRLEYLTVTTVGVTVNRIILICGTVLVKLAGPLGGGT